MSEQKDVTSFEKFMNDEIRNYGPEEGKKRILALAKRDPGASEFLVQSGADALVSSFLRRAGLEPL
jgi:hypothetical protein